MTNRSEMFSMRMTADDKALVRSVADIESALQGFHVSDASIMHKAFKWYVNTHHPELLEK